VNLGQIDDATCAYLGIASTDRALSPARRYRWINDALNELRAELPSGWAYEAGTATPNGGTGRVYSQSGFSVGVSALRTIVAVRLESHTGAKLREVEYEQLQSWAGYAYAITGPDDNFVLHTSPDVEESATLYVVTEEWHTELAASTDTPSWLPTRFHDIPALMAAEVGFSSGNEGQMPERLSAKLIDRRAQLRSHVTRRSADVSKVREPESQVL
jgi:hypothetical protein